MPDITIALTHSETKARKAIGECIGEVFSGALNVYRHCDATTHILINHETAETRYLVFMKPNLDLSASVDAALLAHEATHIAMDYLGGIGEKNPSEELTCYTIQTITCFLVDEHFKWKTKKLDARE